MKKYRLKKEAVPYFKESIATVVLDYDSWKELNVDPSALEEIKPIYVTYGIKKDNNTYTSLSGWDEGDGSHFEFTIHFPSVKYCESDKFMKGRNIRKLMDEIQSDLDSFYENFVNETED